MSHKVTEIVLSASRAFAYPNRSLSTVVALRVEPSGDLSRVESLSDAQKLADQLVDEHREDMARYLDEAEQNEKARMLVPALERDVEHTRKTILRLSEELEKAREALRIAEDLVPCRCGHSGEEHDMDDDEREDASSARWTKVCSRKGCSCTSLTYPWEQRHE